MSYFNNEQTTTSAQTSGTTGTQLDQEDYLSIVVKEKGEQWSDPKTLAKGYIHAQRMIEDQKKLLEASAQQDYAKELLDQLRQAQKPAETPKQTELPGTQTAGTTGQGTDDIKSLIDKALSDREVKTKEVSNLQRADEALTRLFGDKVASVVDAKAQALGLSKEKLREIAAESPSAFIALVAPIESKQSNTLIQGTLNTANDALTRSNERNAQYYSELRKKDIKLYMTPAIQRQMVDDRIRLGEAYYK